MSKNDTSENALYTAVAMLITIAVIVAIVALYKHCEAVDERIRDCLSTGHHTAAECRAAYTMDHS